MPPAEEPVKRGIDPSRRPELHELAVRFSEHAEAFRKSDGLEVAGTRGARIEGARLSAEAADYSLNLHGYWSYVLRRATDGYLYYAEGTAANKSGLDRLNGSLEAVDRQLTARLQTWEEATSPYGDRYDADEIRKSARDLLTTIQQAGARVAEQLQSESDLSNTKNALFLETVRHGLSGLSDQIAQRLGALAAGSAVERVTITSRTRQLLERAERNPGFDQIAALAQHAQALRDGLRDRYTPENVARLLARQTELAATLNDRALSVEDRRKLTEEQAALDRDLELFHEAIDNVRKSGSARDEIQEARDNLANLNKKLINQTDSKTRASLAKEANAAAEKLMEVEVKEKYLAAATKAAQSLAHDSQTRLESYKQSQEDALGALANAKEPASYWRELKAKFLSEVESAADRKRRRLLDDAFNSGFAEQLQKWRDEQNRDRLNPVKLQDIASGLIETADSYAKRAELALKDLDPALVQQIRDDLDCGLAAIRDTVTKELGFLFDNGAFDRVA